MVLKAEIHCHIEGAVSPELAQSQADRYGVDLSDIITHGSYVWADFTQFLKVYDKAASLFRTADDYALLAEDYLTSIARDGAIYSEFFISTDHARAIGISETDYIGGLAEGMTRAKANTGIESRMIATGLRHGGPEAVERAARYIVEHPHPLVTGWGMAGEERMHHPKDFVRPFDMAREAGLHITVHAGELAGAQSVRDAMDFLKPERIGHGVRAIEDVELVKRIADEGIVLECCPGSNIALKVFPDFAHHPFPALRKAGCKVTLNSDDPPHFHTSLQREYDIARENFGMDDTVLTDITRTAIEAAFVDEATKASLLARLS